MYTKCAASAKRISEVLETPDSFFVTEDPSEGDDKNFISFENVSFSYLGKKNNIDSLSVSVPKGGTLGIIGATGSGKSTLLQILAGNTISDNGTFSFGYNVRLGYYDQYQHLNEKRKQRVKAMFKGYKNLNDCHNKLYCFHNISLKLHLLVS